MSLTPVINVDITIDSTGVPRKGFGTSLIASHNATWPERTRSYGGTAEVADDWATDSPEYLCAASVFGQANPPEVVKIGRVAASVLQQYTIEIESAVALKLYSLGVSGQDFEPFDAEATAGASPTIGSIVRDLVNAFNSGALEVLTFTDLAVSAVDQPNDELDFAAPHALSTGDGPVRLENTGGALPAGLAVLTDYFIIAADTDSVSFATSRADALEGIKVDITGAGSGTHALVDTTTTKRVDNKFTAAYATLVLGDFTFTAAASDICTAVAHGLNTGDGPFQLTTSAADLPLNLLTATDYYAIRLDADTFKLAISRKLAFAGTAVDIGDAGTGVHTVDILAGTKSPSLAFTVTGDESGDWFSIDAAMADAAYMTLSQTHAAGTLDADLAEILDEDDDWYCLLTLYNSYAYAREAAAWAQANDRIYVFDCNDTEAITTAFDIENVSSTDLIGAICASGYSRVMASFHQRPSAFLSAAWMGRWLPTTPGKATAALKTLVGPETTKLKTTHFNNLEARRGNAYIYRGGRGITWESKVASVINLYLDVTRNVDFVIDGVETIGFGILAGAEIIPYTADGIAQLAGGVRGFLTGEATDNGVFDRDPPPAVIPPKMSVIPTQDRKERVLRTMKFSGRLAGAIHAADINGTVTF